MRLAIALLAAAALAAPAVAQQDLTQLPAVPTSYKAKKTAWGEPNFTGGWPIERSASRRSSGSSRSRSSTTSAGRCETSGVRRPISGRGRR